MMGTLIAIVMFLLIFVGVPVLAWMVFELRREIKQVKEEVALMAVWVRALRKCREVGIVGEMARAEIRRMLRDGRREP